MASRYAAYQAPAARRSIPLSSIAALPRWSILLFVAACARMITFGNPVVHVDEQFYFVTAQRMLQGALPYVGIWDRKPIGLFLIYLPAAAFGPSIGIWVYQAMALASVTATALLIARLAERAGWARGALVAGLAYVLWLDLFDGQGGQSPVFYNLLMVGAATLLIPDPHARRPQHRQWQYEVMALGLVGLALQIKYSAVFEGMYFGLWCLWRDWRLNAAPRRLADRAVVLVGAALLPTATVLAIYILAGHGEAFFYANFASALSRPTLPGAGAALARITLFLAPLALATMFAWRARTRSAERVTQQWLFGWVVAALIGLALPGSWIDHYALPVLVPLTICCAGFVTRHRHGQVIAVAGLAVALVAGQAMLIGKRAGRGTPDEFGAIVRAIGSGPGCLYVYSGDPMLYAATQRCVATAYLFPNHLERAHERRSIGVDQGHEILRILATRPARIVMRPSYSDERPELRALVMARLARDYRLEAVLPYGNTSNEVYALR